MGALARRGEIDVSSPGTGGERGFVDPREVIRQGRSDRERDDFRDGIGVKSPHQRLELWKEIGPSLADEQDLCLLLDLPLPPEKGADGRDDVYAGSKALLQQRSGDPLSLLG